MENNLLEKQIVKIWQHLLSQTELVTEDGEPIKILYPGRINDDRGADFRDAVIVTRDRLVRGDIEVHVKSSDWRAHQHHHNPAYDRVVLHVVMWDDAHSTTNLDKAKAIPILALDKLMKSTANQWLNLPSSVNTPCLRATDRLTTGIITEFLDSAGKERFLTKTARFQTDLVQMEASQSLYQGIMGALGYSKNKLPFLELARRLPLQALESVMPERMPDEEYLARQQALLLGTAGLLPSQHPGGNLKKKPDNKWIEKLERWWASYHQTAVMSAQRWHRFKVRPNNSPVRRIVAMSYLLLRYRKRGTLTELVNMVKEVSVNQGHHQLEEGVVVTVPDYGARYLDLDSSGMIDNTTLIGSKRAADIVVNIILPFILAWSRLISLPELENKALNLYYRYPRLTVNAVEKHMSHQFGLSSTVVSSARRQQGLIHIYKTLCTQGRCHYCPIKPA